LCRINAAVKSNLNSFNVRILVGMLVIHHENAKSNVSGRLVKHLSSVGKHSGHMNNVSNKLVGYLVWRWMNAPVCHNNVNEGSASVPSTQD